MNILYHNPICPLSRQVRFYLEELNINHELKKVNYTSRTLNPGFVIKKENFFDNFPILNVKEDNLSLIGEYSIIEFLSENYKNFIFMPQDKVIKADIRNYLNTLNKKFFYNTSYIYIEEKFIRFANRVGVPRTDFLRRAKQNIIKYFYFISDILSENSFLIHDKISSVDIALASHISVLDYFSAINWDMWYHIGNWYSIIKSRSSFRKLLQDRIPGFLPPEHYSKLDFI